MKTLLNRFFPLGVLCFLIVMSIGQLDAAPIFGIESIDSGGGPNSQAPTTLYTFDSTNGVFSGLSNIGVIRRGASELHTDGLAYSESYGLFAFELNGGRSRLIHVNTANAQATTVGAFVSGDLRGAAFSGRKLLALDSQTNRLMTVDVSTGSIRSSMHLKLGKATYNLGNSVDLAVKDGVVYIVEGGRVGSGTIVTGNGVNGTNIFSVDLNTGLLTLLKQDLVNEPLVNQRLVGHGAAFEAGSSLLHVSEMNMGDGLFHYDVSNNYARTGLVSEVVPGTNSGRGDLASDSSPVPEPATLGLMGASLVTLAIFLRRKA